MALRALKIVRFRRLLEAAGTKAQRARYRRRIRAVAETFWCRPGALRAPAREVDPSESSSPSSPRPATVPAAPPSDPFAPGSPPVSRPFVLPSHRPIVWPASPPVVRPASSSSVRPSDRPVAPAPPAVSCAAPSVCLSSVQWDRFLSLQREQLAELKGIGEMVRDVAASLQALVSFRSFLSIYFLY